jgi:uncharacterized protein
MSPPGRPKGEYRRAKTEGTPVNRSPAVASPCVNVCKMDARTGWCEGCLRTLDEIAVWSALSDDDRRALWAELRQRRIVWRRERPDAAA